VVPFISLATILYCFYILHIQEIDVYIWSLYLGYGINALLAGIFIIPQFSKDRLFKKVDVKELFIYGIGTEVAGFLHFINNRMVFYFIFYLLGEGSLGFFSISIVLIESVWIVSRSICVNQYSQIVNSTSQLEQRQLTKTSMQIVATLSIGAYICLLLIPPSLYESLLGRPLPDFKHQLYFLLPGGISISISNVWGTYFSGRGKYYVNIVKSGMGLVVIASVSWLLLNDHNLTGAAIALSAGHVISGIVLFLWYTLEPKERTHESVS
jgi:O-antigen/teichoic acid export membrane protein